MVHVDKKTAVKYAKRKEKLRCIVIDDKFYEVRDSQGAILAAGKELAKFVGSQLSIQVQSRSEVYLINEETNEIIHKYE